jgi:hydroxymethylbilane synthase
VNIRVAGRQSPLSQVQVHEVLTAIQQYHPEVTFDPYLMESHGDKDLKTSLRTLEKTDFFTREVDHALLRGDARIAIHSAKDLPEPLPKGLSLIALTRGINPADALVIGEGCTLNDLPIGALIATSSIRREEIVKLVRPDFKFCDLRGTIAMRLEKLFKGEVDGVVVAEAALIRLQLTHLNRIILPGEPPAYQGQLAIMAREDDLEMAELFQPLDSRKKQLYIGLEAPKSDLNYRIEHLPLIEIIPTPVSNPEIKEFYNHVPSATHILFTSKTAVSLFFKQLGHKKINATFIAVGKSTADSIKKQGYPVDLVAELEQAEGVIALLKKQNLDDVHILWPHSALSRRILIDFFENEGVKYTDCSFYTTVSKKPDVLPDLNDYDAIFFSSPSTVDAFISIFGSIPQDKNLICQGMITKNHLDDLIKSTQSHRITINLVQT